MSSTRYMLNLLEEEEDNDDETTLTLAAISLQHTSHSRNHGSRHGGSVINHRVIDRNRLDGHNRLYRDCFCDNPVYPDHIFCKRLGMHKTMFFRIQQALESHDEYFVQRANAAGIPRLSSLQKITVALRMLAYGVAADAVDEYCRLGVSTTIQSLKKVVKSIFEIFGEQYLRRPNGTDIARLMAVGEQRGFPGMLGSIDCIHWKWKNCPTAWRGMYTGHIHEPTIILEAIASYDLWIWHAFFGLPGSLNDINVLDRLKLFSELAEGHGPNVHYTINGHEYDMGYYLADGIYPPWPNFVKTIPSPQGNKRILFPKIQEFTRKDAERAFGVLQARFAIVCGPARFWDVETLKYIMTSCIVLHNMIVKDERHIGHFDFNYDTLDETPSSELSRTHTVEFAEFMHVHLQVRDRKKHVQLQNDLVEHIWQRHKDQNVDLIG